VPSTQKSFRKPEGKKNMGKKKKGKKGKKGKKVEEVKEPSPYANWSLDEMREEIVKKRKQLNKKQLDRNYVQLERDTIQTFYDITKRETNELELTIQAKDREMEAMEENHRVEVRVYVQKVKHLEYEHKNDCQKVTRDGDIAVDDESGDHKGREVNLLRVKKSLKLELKEKELHNEIQITEWKDKHSKNLSKLREEFGKNLKALEERYQRKLEQLESNLELRRKVEVHEIEERKNLHINNLMKKHEEAFGQIKDYYNDITNDNLTLIRKLKDEVSEMKEKKRENQKLMQDIAAENKQLLEPLHVAVRQVEELRRDLKDYEKDKLSLKNSKGRLIMLKRRVARMSNESKALEERYEKIEGERTHLLETFQGTVEQVSRKSELKNIRLGEKLERVDTEYGTRTQQLHEVIQAARLDPAVIAAITERIGDAIDARNVMVTDLQYEVARVTKAYNDVIRTYGSKLMEFGIPPEEVQLRALPTQTSTLPAGLVPSN
jgi:hypothetical protein